MRYVTVGFVPEGGAMNAVEQQLADEPSVTREALHHIRILSDGTGVLLCELTADRAAVESIFETHPDVIAYSVSEVEDALLAHVHQKFPGDVGTLLMIPQKYELIVDTPIEYRDDGSFEVTVIGEQDTIREAFKTVPDGVDFEIEAVGEYRPGAERIFAKLTDRQQEAVEVAHRLGYFENPRGATYKDIADVLGCRPETVGEHLRKAQKTLFSEVVPQ